MIMIATVREVRPNRLVVRNLANGQVVVVNTRNTRCFFVGDRISIFYNGVMTLSIPPQIFGIRIRHIFPRRSC